MASSPSRDIYAETLAVFERSDYRYEPLTTPEVAAALDENRRTVYKRLQKLVDRGELETKATGANSRVWWRAHDGSLPTHRVDSDSERSGELEQRNRQIPSLFEDAPDGIAVHDGSGSILDVNETLAEMLGYPRATLRSMNIQDFEVGLDIDRLRAEFRTLESGVMQQLETEGVHRRKDGTTYPTEVWVSKETTDEGDSDQFVAFVRDITERKRREAEIAASRDSLEDVIDAVSHPLQILDVADYTLQKANSAAIAQEGETCYEVSHQRDRPCHEGENAWPCPLKAVTETGEPVTVEHTHYDENGDERIHEVHAAPVLDEDGTVVRLVESFFDITERKHRERQLEQQREQLAVLNDLNEIVLGIGEAVIDQSTREGIEQAVSDRLAEAPSYGYGWVGALDSNENTVVPQAQAGSDGTIDETPISTVSDDPSVVGPIGSAVGTGEMQITRIPLQAQDSERGPEAVLPDGSRTSAAIPIIHKDSVYGVICLASERDDAFDEAEQAVIARLGELVGHAIAAVERKRALLNDEVVQLEFRMIDVETIGLPDSSSGRIVFDRIIPLGDGTYRQYGIATGDKMETIQALVETDRTPHAGPVNVIETSEDETRFELRLIDPPFLPNIVDAGGYVHEARIEDGKYFLQVHLPPSADVSRIVEVVKAEFPATEMVSRTQTTRVDSSPEQIERTLSDRLTDRQRAALEAAYVRGFFEWPRKSSGEEVAEALAINSSTFHQHLRRSQQTLLEVVFGSAER